LKLLFDANLSPKLATSLAGLFPDSAHVFHTGLARFTSDETIWEYARANGFTIVTADSDFLGLCRLRGTPPKVIWLENCNDRTSRAEALFATARDSDCRVRTIGTRHSDYPKHALNCAPSFKRAGEHRTSAPRASAQSPPELLGNASAGAGSWYPALYWSVQLGVPNLTKHNQHDPRDLADALEHVMYKMWKYKQSVADYQQITVAGGDAAIEFRVLHHRVLLEFFFGPAKHPDNIVAWEYIPDWEREHSRGNLKWFKEYIPAVTPCSHTSQPTDL
jgi:predicted nuclease of predicted toxin-antitoxin system